MFKIIQKFFDENLGHGEDSSLSRETLSLAAAAILFEVARADFDFSPVERKTLSELVAEQFNLNDEETEKLLLLAANFYISLFPNIPSLWNTKGGECFAPHHCLRF